VNGTFAIADLPADEDIRRRVARWLVDGWPHLFPDDTEDWYLHVWDEADRTGARPPHGLVATVNGVPVGTASMVLDDELPGAKEPGPWLAAVWVEPSHRRHGIGGALVRAVMERAHGPLWLYTEDGVEWYGAMGWHKVRGAELNGHAVTVMTWSS
jgi:GNAT superfamily N-acetyltransferase